MPKFTVAKQQSTWLDRVDANALEAILDCIYEAVCVIDTEGRVRFWNTSSELLYSVMRHSIIGHEVKEFFPTALVDRVRVSRVAEKNMHHTPRQGSHILATAMPLEVGGRFMGAVSSDRDYAEVEQLYRDLEEAKTRMGILELEIRKLSSQFGDVIGNSPCVVSIINRARQVAGSNTSVLLSGESGTGKEVFARKIHELSGREGLFVPVNCSAIPSELFESEFFGYAPGAFTGANRKGKPGLFELAEGGTLFLDEIGEMAVPMQAKLLRALQEREVVRVGGEKSIKLNVRIVSASNAPLDKLLQEGKFREDLYYRLNVVEIKLPALRERKEDIPVLVDHYVREFARRNDKTITEVEAAAMRMLCAYSWPGNIRELMNVVENMVVTANSPKLSESHIPEYIIGKAHTLFFSSTGSLNIGEAIRELECQYIHRAMEKAGNNKSRAACLLGMPRATLYHKLEQYGLSPA